MNLTWDLDILYKGYDDPKYSRDLEEATKLIKEINDKRNGKSYIWIF